MMIDYSPDEGMIKLKTWGGTNREWAVDKVVRHCGSYSDAEFEIKWTAGDKTWLPYHEVSHLRALADYFEAIGVTGIENLRWTGNEDLSDNDLQVSFGHSAPHAFGAYISCLSRQQDPTPSRLPRTHCTASPHSNPPSQLQHPKLPSCCPPPCEAPQL